MKPDLSGLRAPVLGFFADKDDFVPPAAARSLEADLRAAGHQVEFAIFEGADHGFFNDTRHQVHHTAHAQECWVRMLEFFNQHLHEGSA